MPFGDGRTDLDVGFGNRGPSDLGQFAQPDASENGNRKADGAAGTGGLGGTQQGFHGLGGERVNFGFTGDADGFQGIQ